MKYKKLLIVTGDTNDADYITEEHWDIDDETINRFSIILSKLRLSGKSTSHNKQSIRWGISEYVKDTDRPEKLYSSILTQDEINFVNDIIPYGEYQIHTIVKVQIIEYISVIDI